MRYLLLLAAFVAGPSWAQAAYYLYCDLDAAATHYAYQACSSIDATGLVCQNWGNPWSADQAAYQGTTGKQCRYDVSSVALGRHIVRVRAINTTGWGGVREESTPSDPFAFTRPAALARPAGLRLAP